MDTKDKKLNHEEFFKVAIVKLRDVSRSRGIHSVFSGFNQAFREYFGEDPVGVSQELARSGKIEVRPVKRGVMLYLPGEAPQSRDEQGRRALSKILNEAPEHDKGLVEKVVAEVAPNGVETFPDNFLEGRPGDQLFVEIDLPGTQLQLDAHSQSILVSPKRHFRYEARNPSEAKYILYAHKIGLKKLKIPMDNRALFKAVANYESYCQQIRSQCFSLFLKHTNDESTAELLAKEAERKLDLRANRSA